MADPASLTERRRLAQPQPRKSCSSFLCKSFFIILLLVLLPLFPSQAPDFVNQTILTKLWELLHLLFIGIAVSYGLFGRKVTEQDGKLEPNLENSQPYLSGILHLSSIFDVGYEKPSGSDEKIITQNWNQCLESESMVVAPEERFLHEHINPRSVAFQNDLENPSSLGLGEGKVRPTLDIQYSQGESMVGFAQENEWAEPRSINPPKGLENPPGLGDRKVIRNCNFQYFQSESVVGFAQENCVLSEWVKPRLVTFQNGLENPSRPGEGEQSHNWDFQYFQGEANEGSAQENCVLYDWANPNPSPDLKSMVEYNPYPDPKSMVEYKPLGLPVRSLRSGVLEDENPEPVREDDGFNSDSKFSCNMPDRSRNDEIRGLTPLNLEEKFKETVHLPSSPLPWRPRSSRMEVMEENVIIQPPSHSRPLSVGEFELTHLKSDSFWSPIFSRTSSVPSLANEALPPSTVSVEVQKMKMEDLERKEKSSCPSSSQASRLSSVPRNGEELLLNANTRRFSIGSLSEMNMERSSGDNLNDFSRRTREIQFHKGKRSADSFNDYRKPPASIGIGSSSQMDVQRNSEAELNDFSKSKRDCDDNCNDFSQREIPLGAGKRGSDALNMKPPTSISIGSLLEMNKLRNCDDNLKNFRKRDCDNTSDDLVNGEDPLGMEKRRVDALTANKKPPTSISVGSLSEMNMKRSCDMKPSAHVKRLPRGKSVRTIRSNALTLDGKRMGDNCSDRIDERVKKTSDMSEAILVKNQGRKAKPEQQPKNVTKEDLADPSLDQRSKQDILENNMVEPEKGSEKELESFQLSSDEEETRPSTVSEAELDSEVDRKAGEFIARFREQIRLQKVASLKGLNGW
ncbi:hypothetical protein NMG60_11029201 [Bertholletia excelsa]